MSLAEFNELAQRDPSVDRQLDDRQMELLRKGNVILEGRMSGWLAHANGIEALKVWLTCDANERIRRLVDRDGGDPEEQLAATEARVQQEHERYRRYYGADLNDVSIYDLVLDSTATPPADLVKRVLQAGGREPRAADSGPV
jgi:predicted cytidylate kinase